MLRPPATITRRPSLRHVATASEPVVAIVLPPCSTNSFAPPFFWRQTRDDAGAAGVVELDQRHQDARPVLDGDADVGLDEDPRRRLRRASCGCSRPSRWWSSSSGARRRCPCGRRRTARSPCPCRSSTPTTRRGCRTRSRPRTARRPMRPVRVRAPEPWARGGQQPSVQRRSIPVLRLCSIMPLCVALRVRPLSPYGALRTGWSHGHRAAASESPLYGVRRPHFWPSARTVDHWMPYGKSRTVSSDSREKSRRRLPLSRGTRSRSPSPTAQT